MFFIQSYSWAREKVILVATQIVGLITLKEKWQDFTDWRLSNDGGRSAAHAKFTLQM